MSKLPRLFGLLSLLLLVIAALALVSGSSNSAQAAPAQSVVLQACDPSGSIDGTAVPSTIRPGDVITFTATGFTNGEEVSYWFTDPEGNVAGTAQPLCCAPPSGVIRFPPIPFPSDVPPEAMGRWALTVQGANSQHTSVIYFCVVTQVQPTNTPVPPTSTPAPPTATSAPPTATSVPASPTVATSPTVTDLTPTAGVSPTAVPPTSVPTVEATATAPPIPTAPPPPPTLEPTAMPTPSEPTTEPPVTPGMPRSGQFDITLYVLLALVALSMMSIGLLARRSSKAKQ